MAKKKRKATAEQIDEQIFKTRQEVRYDTRDFPIETIVSRFNNDRFYVPDYQRDFIWQEKNQSLFIESVMMGLPIPMMFIAESTEDGTFEIVDGVQRISTLDSFVSNDLVLTGLQKLTRLNELRFSDLPRRQQERFNSWALRIVVLDPSTSDESRQAIFERINKSGKALTPSERRRGAFPGRFMTLVHACAKSESFLKVCPISNTMRKRKEDIELVTRFFAYSECYEEFTHDVDQFLDDYVKKNQRIAASNARKLQQEFARTMDFVDRYFPHGFGKTAEAKVTPRVRFEAIAVGVNLALRKSPDLKPNDIVALLASAEFLVHTTTHASNSGPRLRGRIEFIRDALLG